MPDSAAPRRAASRGSVMSDKQVNAAVRDNRQVQALLHDGTQVAGWICGVDDYHWALVDESAVVHLVHKSAPSLTILRPTLDTLLPLDQRGAILKIVNPYRSHVLRVAFSMSEPQI